MSAPDPAAADAGAAAAATAGRGQAAQRTSSSQDARGGGVEHSPDWKTQETSMKQAVEFLSYHDYTPEGSLFDDDDGLVHFGFPETEDSGSRSGTGKGSSSASVAQPSAGSETVAPRASPTSHTSTGDTRRASLDDIDEEDYILADGLHVAAASVARKVPDRQLHTTAQVPKMSEGYGFVGWLTTALAILAFLGWALAPESMLHYWGVTHYPSRYWGVAIPVFLIGLYCFVSTMSIAACLIMTPALSEPSTFKDEYTIESRDAQAREHNEMSTPLIFDLPIAMVSNLQFGRLKARNTPGRPKGRNTPTHVPKLSNSVRLKPSGLVASRSSGNVRTGFGMNSRESNIERDSRTSGGGVRDASSPSLALKASAAGHKRASSQPSDLTKSRTRGAHRTKNGGQLRSRSGRTLGKYTFAKRITQSRSSTSLKMMAMELADETSSASHR